MSAYVANDAGLDKALRQMATYAANNVILEGFQNKNGLQTQTTRGELVNKISNEHGLFIKGG